MEHILKKSVLVPAALALGLALLACGVYAPALHNGFAGLDDSLYVFENTHVLNGITWNGVHWAFSLNTNSYWHPVTWLSLMLDTQLFGSAPLGYHLTNVLLHASNVALFFCLLFLATGRQWPSVAAAALFAVHPMHVEAVAWITSRKDVLSTFFFLLSASAYVLWATRGGSRLRCLSILSYALSVMAKPAALSLPFALLLFDVWPLRRLSLEHPRQAVGLLREKLPYFIILPFTLALVLLSHPLTSTAGDSGNITLALRVANLPLAYIAYLRKFFWPNDLAMFYAFPTSIPLWRSLTTLALLAGISVWAVLRLKTRPSLPVGWFFFLGTMFPMIGLVQAGLWPAMADRYSYLPFLGLYTALAFGGADLLGRWAPRPALAVGMAAVLAALLPVTRAQTRLWNDSEALFRQTTINVADNWMGHLLLGSQLAKQNRLDEAEQELQRTITINPQYSATYSWVGVVLQRQGRLEESLPYLSKAAALRPNSAPAWNNLGVLLAKLGRLDEASRALEKALEVDPGFEQARTSLEKIQQWRSATSTP